VEVLHFTGLKGQTKDGRVRRRVMLGGRDAGGEVERGRTGQSGLRRFFPAAPKSSNERSSKRRKEARKNGGTLWGLDHKCLDNPSYRVVLEWKRDGGGSLRYTRKKKITHLGSVGTGAPQGRANPKTSAHCQNRKFGDAHGGEEGPNLLKRNSKRDSKKRTRIRGASPVL